MVKRAALALLTLLLAGCEAYWADCPDWTGPAVVVLDQGRFYNLRGQHVDSREPERCSFRELP